MNLGWLCMSWRQPERIENDAAANSNHAVRICARRLIGHLRNLLRIEALQQLSRIGDAEARVLRLNTEKEPVTAGAYEVGRVKDWMIGLRQAVQRQHAENCGQRSAKNRAFKRHGDERGPGVERLSTHVDGIVDYGNPVLERITANHPQQGANQHNQGDAIVMRANRLGRLFQWIRSVGIHLAITGGVGAFSRLYQLRRRLEFRHESVNRSCSHYSFTFACGNSARISKMEMAGISRINIKKSSVKNPMVPIKIAMSHLVNQYMPQELGT